MRHFLVLKKSCFQNLVFFLLTDSINFQQASTRLVLKYIKVCMCTRRPQHVASYCFVFQFELSPTDKTTYIYLITFLRIIYVHTSQSYCCSTEWRKKTQPVLLCKWKISKNTELQRYSYSLLLLFISLVRVFYYQAN